ncbi:hypothetical protein, partial [Streptococcus merionis]|uniref:poly(ethylene terephthalate) hydrolase family protein n=1 Tax=Streptococcus merionis TaxID=400065 RepID=UPI0026F28E33
ITPTHSMPKKKNENYYNYSNPTAKLETKYTALGTLAVSRQEYATDDKKIGKFVIQYPSKLESSDKKYPIVLWANGTGSKSDTYNYFLNHLASWGFIVVSSDDENSRSGESLNKAIDLLITENENIASAFYNKIDLNNIGLGGHSQGGPAVFNMATVQPHKDMIKTVYAASATSSYHTKIFKDGWEYDISKITVPTFLTAGTGSFDAGTATSANQKSDEKAGIMQGITPLWSLEENFNLLPNSIDKVYVRKTNVDHGDSHLQFDGYMTAWFRYYLMNDRDAEQVFYGDESEMTKHPNYQDVTIHRGEKY